MKKNHLLNFLFIVFSITAFAQRPAQGPMSDKFFKPLKNGYQLVWEDDFLGNQLDHTKWAVRGVGRRAIAYVSAEAVKVENGVLKLKDQCTKEEEDPRESTDNHRSKCNEPTSQ
jgi:hypothetical protein